MEKKKQPLTTKEIKHMQYKALLLSTILTLIANNLVAEEAPAEDRIGLSYIAGQMIDPNNDSYVNAISFSYLTPYSLLVATTAPEYIRLRSELAFARVNNQINGVYTSAVFMAVRYLNKTPDTTWRPYIEAGIGLSYASYRIEGQAYKVNFNPQIGFGTDYTTSAGNTYFSSFRLSHFSNGSLNHDNKGINTLNLSFGRYF